MKPPRHPTRLRRLLDARVKALRARRPPLAASLCQNAAGGWHVTLKERGKTRTVFVPADLKEEVEASIQEHRRLKPLLGEITQVQLELIRGHRTWALRRAGRP
jgi:hypothetical protein